MQKMIRLMAVASTAFALACSGGTTGTTTTDGGTDGGGGGSTTSSSSGGSSSSMMACSVDTDGGSTCPANQYCDTGTGSCILRCEEGTAPDCPGTDVYNPDTGRCQTPCTAQDCTSPQICGPVGLCEDECVSGPCLALEQICDVATNACGDPDEATRCMFADTVMAPARHASGPIIYDATVRDGNLTEDVDNCGGTMQAPGGRVVFVTFSYYDSDGDITRNNICSFMPADGSSSLFKQWNTNVMAGKVGCANNESTTMGSTSTEGTATVPLCFEATRPDDFVFQLTDDAGNPSNAVCVDLPAMM